jgi:hypothetical protein
MDPGGVRPDVPASGAVVDNDRVKIIGLVMITAFVLWFLYMGFNLVGDMIGFSW